MPPDEIENAAFSVGDQAVLQRCEQMAMTNVYGYMTQDLHTEFPAHFSDAQIFEAGTTMAVF